MMNGIIKKLLYITLMLILYSPAFAQEYLDVTRDYKLKFPEDFFYKKDYRVQWWYFTGHLFDDSGREFGYELTFFVVNVQKRDLPSKFGVNQIYSHILRSLMCRETGFISLIKPKPEHMVLPVQKITISGYGSEQYWRGLSGKYI